MGDSPKDVERGAAILDEQIAQRPLSIEEKAERLLSGSSTNAEQGDDACIALLAELSPVEYERARAKVSKRMAIRASVLDKLVQDKRKEHRATEGITFAEVAPWPEVVAGKTLLSDIFETISRFIVCKPETAQAAALWVVMTWCMDVVQVAPLAVITAPEKRCGKSQLLTLLGKLSCRALVASNITAAALFRVIDAWHPTLMVDESDAFMRENEELRGIFNSGHTRDSAYVLRVVGDEFEPKQFSTWGAKAIAGIGKLADTLMDRAVTLELRRKLPHEKVQRLRDAEPDLFDHLRARLCRFAQDNREAVRIAKPQLPHELNDRAQDNWEPLLAIADIAGGIWPETARQAAIVLSGGVEESAAIGSELLADIREIFEARREERISTKELIEALCAEEEKRWASYNRGKWINPRQVARWLKEYGIASKTIRVVGETPKGYERAQFEDAFSRYVPSSPFLSATTPQPNNHAGFGVADKKTESATSATAQQNSPAGCGVVADSGVNVAYDNDQKATEKRYNHAGCGVVADKNEKKGECTACAFDEDEREAFEERAAIMEFDGGLSREVAERRARKEVIGKRHSCWWRLSLADGKTLTVFVPSGNTRADVLKDYPDATSAEAFTLDDSSPDAPMVGEEEAAVRAWLIRLGDAFCK